MIEPVRQGQELLDEIARTAPPAGTLAVWWLGQSGFLFKSRQGMLAIDLYLSEHLTRKYEGTSRPHIRMTRAPLDGRRLTGLDLVLVSHKHSDHLDPETLPALVAASQAIVVLPEAIKDHAVAIGLPAERLLGVDSGDLVERAGFRVRAVPAAHEGLDTDSSGHHLYLGYVIESEGLRLYHSGDSLAYPGLAETLATDPFDVLFLPINGRDRARGVPGNMTAHEAVELANQVHPRYVVPHHYDMFTFNTAAAQEFLAEARALSDGGRPKVLSCGERWEVSR